MSLQTVDIGIVVLYLIGVLAFGIWIGRRDVALWRRQPMTDGPGPTTARTGTRVPAAPNPRVSRNVSENGVG